MRIKLIIVALMLLAGALLNAQTKIGHLDIQALFEKIPEVKAALDSLEAQRNALEAKGTAMLDEYTAMRDNYEKRRANMSEADRKKKEEELNMREQQIMAFRENGQSMLEKKSKDMLKPVRERVRKAIEDVAKEKGYDYILDEGEDTVRYANPAFDVTDLVLQKLGIKAKQ